VTMSRITSLMVVALFIAMDTIAMTFAEAKIVVHERVVAIVDHPTKGPMTTMAIRLASQGVE
jgi:hypothetical protein